MNTQEYRKLSAEKLELLEMERYGSDERGPYQVKGSIQEWQPDIDHNQMWMVVEWMKEQGIGFHIDISPHNRMHTELYGLPVYGKGIESNNKDIRQAVMEAYMKYIKL